MLHMENRQHLHQPKETGRRTFVTNALSRVGITIPDRKQRHSSENGRVHSASHQEVVIDSIDIIDIVPTLEERAAQEKRARKEKAEYMLQAMGPRKGATIG